MNKKVLDKMHVGDCFAKKSKKKLTIFRIKSLGEDYYWLTDALHFSRDGILAVQDEPMYALYSDGYKPLASDEFDRIWRIYSITMTAIAPLVLKIRERLA